MVDVVRVALGIEDPGLADELMQSFDRTGWARVVATAADEAQLASAIRQLEPDVVVASSELATSTVHSGVPLIVAELRESVPALKRAMVAGAGGFFVWPDARSELEGALRGLRRATTTDATPQADVIAVLGSRGGAGSSFVATHLADALARSGKACALLDADAGGASLRPVLGAPEGGRSIADLLPVSEELADPHLDEVLVEHPRGFRVLHASPDARVQPAPEQLRSIIGGLASRSEVLVIDMARGSGPLPDVVVGSAGSILCVLTLEVASFHGARRAVERWPDLADRFEFLVNRASRAQVAPHDVARVFGKSPIAIVPEERGVTSAQDRGRLLSGRSRAARIFTELATRLSVGRERAA